MKKKLSLLSILLCLSLSHFLRSETPFAPGITIDNALSIVQLDFEGQDVDYYLIEEINDDVWKIFVDTQPLKGWTHDCYIYTVSKKLLATIDTSKPLNIELCSMPPDEELIPLLVKEKSDQGINYAPFINEKILSSSEIEAAKRTFVIILNGGGNSNMNHDRFWNDCSFLYRTLIKRYGIPKSNIFPIMSDGDNPAKDMLVNFKTKVSQPLDLDGDGINEIKLAATKENINKTLAHIKSRIKKDDHLFFYVIDHGGINPNNNSPFILLWNKKYLYRSDFISMLKPFSDSFVNVNVVLGQCKSGKFVSSLSKIGCVATTACTDNQDSHKCQFINYDSFVYHWTCAINEADHNGIPVLSDFDSDGRVSMKEAYRYALENDKPFYNDYGQQFETPNYCSTPPSLGEDLSFNHIPKSLDLYIKDNDKDTGKERNMTTWNYWESPSVWVRNEKDGIEKHENPLYSPNHTKVYIYVRVHNRGKEEYALAHRYLHINWTLAATGITQNSWKGYDFYNGYPAGGYIRGGRIPNMKPGEYKDMVVEWTLPSDLLESLGGAEGEIHHFCLLARISENPTDNVKEGKDIVDVLASNDIAQKNVSIVKYSEQSPMTDVLVRNVGLGANSYNLELIPRTATDANIYNQASIELTMSPAIYQAWQEGGAESTEISQPSLGMGEDISEIGATVGFLSPESSIQSICMNESQASPVSLKFDFHTLSISHTNYKLDLIQRDSEGNIIGGETFEIEAPELVIAPIDTVVIVPIPYPGGITLSAKAPSNSKLTWFDGKNKKIGENSNINLTSVKKGDTYKLTALNEKGQLAMAEITLDNVSAIKNVSINATGTLLEIEFVSAIAKDSDIMITSLLDGDVKLSKAVNEGEDKISIDISSLSNGAYAVSYLVNNQKIDSRKFNK